MIKPEQHINFAGSDWNALKLWLLATQENKIGLLVSADSHDKSNQIRGSLAMLREILALERAAEMAAQQGVRPDEFGYTANGS